MLWWLLSATYSETSRGKEDHSHDGYQILYVRRGNATVRSAGWEGVVCAGELFLFHRLEPHSVFAASEDYARDSVCFLPASAGESDGKEEDAWLLTLLFNRRLFSGKITVAKEEREELERLLSALCREAEQNRTYRRELTDLLLRELIFRIGRLLPEPPLPQGTGNSAVVLRIRQELEERYTERISVEKLAREHHLSASYLSHLFRSITGYSVTEYLTACRLTEARRLLAGSECPIGEITSACGFSDGSNFGRLFRSRMGISPQEYRRRCREETEKES